MNLSGTQIKDTYGNLVSIGTVAGTPTTGTLQNGAGSDLTTVTVAGTLNATTLGGTLSTAAQTAITSVGTLTGLAVSGDANFDSGTLFVDVSENRVGIGTTSPATKLDVDGVIYAHGSGTSTIYADQVYSSSGDSASAIRINLNSGATGGYLSGYSGWAILSHNTEFIQGSNWVARDTTASRIEQSSGNLIYYSDTGLTAGNSYTPTERFRVTDAGNVGIGTSSPGAKLSVEGSAIFNDAGADVDFRVEGDSNANLLFVDASTDRVGIGKNNPSALLDVNGVALATRLGIGSSSFPTLTAPSGTSIIKVGDALIISVPSTLIPSPYTQSIQIDLTLNDFGSNNATFLFDMMVTTRQWATTSGVAFGKIFATCTGGVGPLDDINTTDLTTSQCAVTVAALGTFGVRVTINPDNNTDRYSVHLTIPAQSSSASPTLDSVSISLV